MEVLEWFKNSNYEFEYTYDAINRAAKHGHIKVLKSFDKSDMSFYMENSQLIMQLNKELGEDCDFIATLSAAAVKMLKHFPASILMFWNGLINLNMSFCMEDMQSIEQLLMDTYKYWIGLKNLNMNLDTLV